MALVRSFVRLSLAVSLFLLFSTAARSQILSIGDDTSVPVPGVGHDYIKLFDETVNPANGSVSLRIQVPMPTGRGLTIPFGFNYDSNGANHMVGNEKGGNIWLANAGYLSQGGWSYAVPRLNSTGFSVSGGSPPQSTWTCGYETNFMFQDANGGRHPLRLGSAYIVYANGDPDVCDPTVPNGGDEETVATLLNATQSFPSTATVSDRDGTIYYFSYILNHGETSGSTDLPSYIEDRNGNRIVITDTTSPNNSGTFSIADTANRTVISSSGFGPSGTTNSISVSGLTQPYKITWETVNASYSVPVTPLGTAPPIGYCSGIAGVSDSLVVVKSIALPNGQSYQFTYDSTYGLLKQIIYPTGASITYTWKINPNSEYAGLESAYGQTNYCQYQYGTPVLATRQVSFNGSTPALTQTFTYAPTTWETGGQTWSRKSTTVSAYDNILSKTAQTIYNYVPVAYDGSYNDPFGNVGYTVAAEVPTESSVVYYNWGNTTTPLRTINKTWYEQYAIENEQTVLDNGASSNTVYCYVGTSCAPNIPIQLQTKSEYGFTGSLARSTSYSYQSFLNTLGPISERPCSVVVSDGNSNRYAETDYFYDGTSSLCSAESAGGSTSAVANLPQNTHDETTFGPSVTTPRGNATKITKQCFVGSQSCTNSSTTATYDETGQILTSVNACGNASCSDVTATSYTTTYSYVDNYDSPPSANTNTYLTKITNPLGQYSSFKYKYSDGQLLQSTDPNGLITSYEYDIQPTGCSFQDYLDRLGQVNDPDGGVTTYCYNDTPSTPSVTTSKTINSSKTLVITSIMDGIGHVAHTQVTSDPQGFVYTDTAYDGSGNVYTVSNPYRSCGGADPTSSCGTTTYLYDTLKRKTSTAYQDGSVLTTAYCGPSTLVADPTLRWRRSVTDGLGRLVEVDEPNSLTAEVHSNGCVAGGDPIWVTSYTLDPLNNLTNVLQNGSHARTFTYDSLSRLLTSANPEVNTITYTYDANSNVQTKTDARAIETTYGYEALNREISRSYSNGDPTVTMSYDQSACLGLAACENIGHRTTRTDGTGSEEWAYEVNTTLSSERQDQRTLTIGSGTVTRVNKEYFDAAGNITQEIYPSGRIVNYTYDAAGRPSTAADSANGITYATGWQTGLPSGCVATAVCYTPQGSFYGLSIGQASYSTGLNIAHSYNSRLQPQEFRASSAAGNAIDITYNFVDSATGKNAGHVNGITNNLDSTRSQTFTYDQLNRVITAQTTSTYATSPAHCWGETYTFDAWANLDAITATTNSNYTGCTEESGFSYTADGNNHLAGFSYDGAGNTTSDTVYSTYLWDGENQLESVNGVSYTYDGDGRRASKAGSKLYWYGAGDEILAETDTSGNYLNDYIFFNGKRVAVLPAGSSAEYYVEDSLGSSRVLTNYAGTPCYDADFMPFGGERAYTNTCSQNYKFEGKERDAETGNDDFGARYYSNRFGRWLSADWSNAPAPVPYANITNPQTLNLYAMVVDDPETSADLDGHCCEAEAEVAQEEVDKIAGPLIDSAESAGPVTGAIAQVASEGVALGIAFYGLIDSFTSLNNARATLKMEEAKAANDLALRRLNAQASQRGKGNQRETQFERMTDDEVSRIARDKNDPRREAAKREEKARGQRRSSANREDKKKKKTPPVQPAKPDKAKTPAPPQPVPPVPVPVKPPPGGCPENSC